MSYKKKLHKSEFEKQYMSLLKPADIVFTTTSSGLSATIKFLANAPISHVNLYSKRGHVIESSGNVQEKDIHKEFEDSNCTRAIAFRYKNIDSTERKTVIAAARKYKGRVWDGQQGIWHGLVSVAKLPSEAIGVILPDAHKTFRLATKRVIVEGLTNLGELDPKRRTPLMCSTLAVYSYLDANIRFDMTNVEVAGSDDLYHHCKTGGDFKRLFDISFTEQGLTINK